MSSRFISLYLITTTIGGICLCLSVSSNMWILDFNYHLPITHVLEMTMVCIFQDRVGNSISLEFSVLF